MSKRLKNRNKGPDKKLKRLLEKAAKEFEMKTPAQKNKLRVAQARSWTRQDKD